MSRRRADTVVIHRLELGLKEREYLEGALTAFQVNQVATPIVAGMSDISFMIVLGSLLKLYWPDIDLPTGESDMESVTDAIYQGIFNAKPDPTRPTLGTDPNRNIFEEIWFNLRNPNWSTNAPGVREAIGDLFD